MRGIDTGIEVKKIRGGFSVDGLELKSGKCGCTSIARCCYTMSKVKRREDGLIEFNAKLTDPDSTDTFSWGYTVRKGGVTVTVRMEDARDKRFYSGYFPPHLEEWVEKGWEVVEKTGQREDVDVWRCPMCKRIYREEREDVGFKELADDWRCPTCRASKGSFEKIG